jgi:hypothetical protein
MSRTPSKILVAAPPLNPIICTAPMPDFGKITGYGHNRNYGLLSTGEVDSFVTETGRRLVVISGSPGSWEAYVERRRTGRERDPAEKAAAILAYKQSLKHSGARNAARARDELHDKRKRGLVTRGDSTTPAPTVAVRSRSLEE